MLIVSLLAPHDGPGIESDVVAAVSKRLLGTGTRWLCDGYAVEMEVRSVQPGYPVMYATDVRFQTPVPRLRVAPALCGRRYG